MRSTSHLMTKLLLVAALAAAGCGGDSKKAETPAAGGATSGGEHTGTAGIESPPGSVQPGDDGSGSSSTGGDGGGGSAAGEAESPWGSPLADQGTPLPVRKPMNPSAQSAYNDGVEAAKDGKVDAAKRAFEKALAADPNAFDAAYNLGVLADRTGNEARALEYYRRSLRIQPDYERAARGTVTIYLRRNQAQNALGFIEPLAKYWQRNLYLQAIYAETLAQVGRLDDAMEAARSALRRDERFVPAMIAIVKASIKQGRFELANSVLDQAIGVNPNDAELHYLKGQMLLREDGRMRDALEHFQKAVEVRPDYAEARTALGVQQLAGANYADALKNLSAAASLSPELVEVHLNLGDAYRANKQWTKAKESFDKAISMKSPLPEAHYNLALMYMSAGATFPGLDSVTSLQKAIDEFTKYRNESGPKLAKDDPSGPYIEELTRQVEREKKRIEREKAKAAKDAERAAAAAKAPAATTPAGGN